jgi:putative transposase
VLKRFYIVFIVDVYSRKIIAWSANDHMQAEANIECLQYAITSRNISPHNKLIHHSDRGSQYGDKNYIALLKSNQIRISMCKEAWQNAYTEPGGQNSLAFENHLALTKKNTHPTVEIFNYEKR